MVPIIPSPRSSSPSSGSSNSVSQNASLVRSGEGPPRPASTNPFGPPRSQSPPPPQSVLHYDHHISTRTFLFLLLQPSIDYHYTCDTSLSSDVTLLCFAPCSLLPALVLFAPCPFPRCPSPLHPGLASCIRPCLSQYSNMKRPLMITTLSRLCLMRYFFLDFLVDCLTIAYTYTAHRRTYMYT